MTTLACCGICGVNNTQNRKQGVTGVLRPHQLTGEMRCQHYTKQQKKLSNQPVSPPIHCWKAFNLSPWTVVLCRTGSYSTVTPFYFCTFSMSPCTALTMCGMMSCMLPYTHDGAFWASSRSTRQAASFRCQFSSLSHCYRRLRRLRRRKPHHFSGYICIATAVGIVSIYIVSCYVSKCRRSRRNTI